MTRKVLADLRLHASGKVREIYEDGDELIMVASDRISVPELSAMAPSDQRCRRTSASTSDSVIGRRTTEICQRRFP